MSAHDFMGQGFGQSAQWRNEATRAYMEGNALPPPKTEPTNVMSMDDFLRDTYGPSYRATDYGIGD